MVATWPWIHKQRATGAGSTSLELTSTTLWIGTIGKNFPFLLKGETKCKDMRAAADRNPKSRDRKEILTLLSRLSLKTTFSDLTDKRQKYSCSVNKIKQCFVFL
jgi:hypothetical protein